MVEVSLTVGKLDASLALLLTKDHHLIEFPTILLPNGIKAGSIVKIKCEQDFETEQEETKQFNLIQDEILNIFGKNLPQSPILKTKNVTQTSCILEWEELDLGTSNLKNLFLMKDGKKLGSIPQPLTNRTTKLSGLPIDQTFKFQLQLDTTAGIYESSILEVTTHKMTDLSGINVCLGDITANEQFTIDDIQDTLVQMGAHHPAQTKVSVDTTHFICTRENKSNPQYLKATEMNIPIIRPEWLKACEKDKRIVGVRDYYVKDCVLPDILAKNFWNKPNNASTPIAKPVNDHDKPVPELPSVIVNGGEKGGEEGNETANEIHEINLNETSIRVTEPTPEKEEPEVKEAEPEAKEAPEVIEKESVFEPEEAKVEDFKTETVTREFNEVDLNEPEEVVESNEPIVEPVSEPVSEPVTEVTEPVVEPVAEVTEPISEPTETTEPTFVEPTESAETKQTEVKEQSEEPESEVENGENKPKPKNKKKKKKNKK